MTYSIESRTLTEQPTAARRANLPAEEVGRWLADTYAGVADYLNRTGAVMAGPPYARFVFAGHRMEVEAGFPVLTPIAGDGSIEPAVLPGGPAAVTTHYGPYEAVEAAYKAIHAWLAEHGYRAEGGHWEIYYTDPAQEPDSSRWRTDVVAPYSTA